MSFDEFEIFSIDECVRKRLVAEFGENKIREFEKFKMKWMKDNPDKIKKHWDNSKQPYE